VNAEGLAAEESPIDRSQVLMQLYEPIAGDMENLRAYLADEFKASEPYVHELLEHLSQFRGKQIRPACVFLAGRCFGEIRPDHVRCAAVVELIHTATLVHDDLLDQADVRRRVETIHTRYGDRASILLGDIIYARGFVISTEVEGAARLLAECTREICIGEIMQVGNAGNLQLTLQEYEEIIHRKTAILYGLSCKLGALLSGASPEQAEAMERYGNRMGEAFQIIDDSLDLIGDAEVVGKSLGTDLGNGKLTLPVLMLRESLDQAGRDHLLDLLRACQDSENAETERQAIADLLAEHGIMDQVRDRARSVVQDALDSLRAAADPSPARKRLEDLAEYILQREL
jgi:octaprenyl-diphosphate synthase